MASEQVVKAVEARFTADTSAYKAAIQQAVKVSEDMKASITRMGEQVQRATALTNEQAQRMSKELTAAGRAAAQFGKQAQALTSSELQLNRAAEEQKLQLANLSDDYSATQERIAGLSEVYDTIKEAAAGLNLSKPLAEQREQAAAEIDRYAQEIEELQNNISSAGRGVNLVFLSDNSLVPLDAAKKKLNQMIQESDRTGERLAQLDAAIKAIGEENLGYATEKGLKQLQDEIGKSQSKLSQLEMQSIQAQSRMTTYAEKLEAVRQKQAELAQSTDDLKTHLAGLGEGLPQEQPTPLEAWSAAVADLQRQVSNVASVVSDGWSAVADWWSDLSSWAGGNPMLIAVGALSDGLHAAVDGFVSLGAAFRSGFQNVCASALSGLLSMGAKVVSGLAHPLQTAGNIGKAALNGLGTAGKAALSGLVNLLPTVGSVAKAALGALGAAAKTAVSGLAKLGGTLGSFVLKVTGISSIANKIKGIGSGARASTGGVEGLVRQIRNLGVVSLGLKVASSLFGQFRSVVSSYVSSNETLSASVERLKNGLGQALAPAINIVINAMERLLPYIVGVAEAIGGLMTNLFGSGWTTVADGAASAAKATEEATAAQEEYNNTVAGFDEITKLDNSSASAGSGSGAAASATDDTGGIIGKLPGWLSELSSQIKALLDAQDFTGIGSLLAAKFGGIVDAAREKLNGSAFREKLSGLVSAVTDGINGFFGTLTFGDGAAQSIATRFGGLIGDAAGLALNTVDQFLRGVTWGNIGTAFAQGINEAIESLSSNVVNFGAVLASWVQAHINGIGGFFKELNWAKIGTYLGENVNSAFSGIDWAKLGATLTDGIIGACTALTAAIKTIDWYQLGEDVRTFLTSIDWPGICQSLFETIGSALGGLAAFLWGVIEEAWDSVVSWWYDTAYEDGSFTIGGLLAGIGDAICDIGSWIKENIFDPFIEGFKSVFGIHSPSTVMAEMGGYLIEGLLDGITGVWDSITGFFSGALDGLTSLLGGAWDTISGAASSAWEGITGVIGGAWNGITSTASGAWNTVTGTVTTAATNIYNAARDKFGGVASTISDKVSGAGTAISNGFTAAKNTVTSVAGNIYNTVSSKFSSVKTSVSDAVGNVYNTASSKFNSVKSSVTTAASNIYSTVSSKFGNVETSMAATFNGLKTSAKTWGKDICANLSNGITGAVSKVTSAVSGVASKIRSFLGFSEPEDGPLSNFHTFMPDMLSLMAKGIRENAGTALREVSDLAASIAGEMQLGAFEGDVRVDRTVNGGTPLNQNNGWKVAQRVSGGSASSQPVTINVTVTLDGKVVGKSVVNYVNGEARRTGVHPLAAYI